MNSTRFLPTLAAAIAAVGCAALLPLAAEPVPGLLVPAGETPRLQLAARGVQIYECRRVDGMQAAWLFIAPEASLFDDRGQPAGRHGAGPHWQAEDGSRIVGTLVAKVVPAATRTTRSPGCCCAPARPKAPACCRASRACSGSAPAAAPRPPRPAARRRSAASPGFPTRPSTSSSKGVSRERSSPPPPIRARPSTASWTTIPFPGGMRYGALRPSPKAGSHGEAPEGRPSPLGRESEEAGVLCLARGRGTAGAGPDRVARPGPAAHRLALGKHRPDASSPFLAALRQGLAEAGRLEGRDFALDAWWGDDSMERFDLLVVEMLRSRPDLIVTQGPIVHAVKRSLTPLPVLFAFSGDPVEAGLVDSLPRPGRNLSGISMLSLELVGKRMQLLAEADTPGCAAWRSSPIPAMPARAANWQRRRPRPSRWGSTSAYLPMRGDAGLDDALQAALRARCEGIVVFPDQSMMRRSERFAAFAQQHRVPATSGWAEFARRGNLMSYGPNIQQVFRRGSGRMRIACSRARGLPSCRWSCRARSSRSSTCAVRGRWG